MNFFNKSRIAEDRLPHIRRLMPVLVILSLMIVPEIAGAQIIREPRFDINGGLLPGGAIARLTGTRYQLADYQILFATLSPDGSTVATATSSSSRGILIHFLDTSTGKIIRQFDLADIDASQMQFSPDGKHLAFSGRPEITLVNITDGKSSQLAKLAKYGVGQFAFSPDGQCLAAQPYQGVSDAPVGLWEIKTGKEMATLPGRGASCRELVFSPDGKRLLLWSIVPSRIEGESLYFDPDSKVALVCFDIHTRKIVGEATTDNTRHIALSPDGETVALETDNRQGVRVRHLPTGTDRCVLPVKVASLAFMPDGKAVFTITKNGRGSLWNALTGDKIRDLDGALIRDYFRIAGISKDSRTIAVFDGGAKSGDPLMIWNAETGRIADRSRGHAYGVIRVAYSPDGRLLATGGDDRTVRLWDPFTGEHLRVLARHKEPISAIAFSPDGKLLASSCRFGETRLTNVANGEPVSVFAGPERGARALAFTPNGKILYVGGDTSKTMAWDIAGAKVAFRHEMGEHGAIMAFATDGDLAVTETGSYAEGSKDWLMRVWKQTDKQPVSDVWLHDGNRGDIHCHGAAFSPEGRWLATSQVSESHVSQSYEAAQLRLWDPISGQPIRTLAPTVTKALAFSPGGRLLAAGSTGQSGPMNFGYGSGIDIWDTVTGEKAGQFPVKPECLAFSPDGRYLASGGQDHCVLIWNTPKIPTVKPTTPSAPQIDGWWAALNGEAEGAYKAIAQMVAAPEPALALLRERVCPVSSGDPETVAKLIARLDSQRYAEREEAQKTLQQMEEGVTHLLTKTLNDKPGVELRARLERLLAQSEAVLARVNRNQRAVATLEWIGTPAAIDHLQKLADGAPAARLTIEARAALKRLPPYLK